MLQACWDCLVGSRGAGEERYSTQLNGNVYRAPPWPAPQLNNEKMFILPKVLAPNDKIVIHGETFYQRRQITIGLVTGFNTPDHSNVACQMSINFADPDKIAIQIIENGNYETVNENYAASDFFVDPQSFEVYFRARSDDVLDIGVGDSYLDSISLKHSVDNIRFLTVHGDIEKVRRLDFTFD